MLPIARRSTQTNLRPSSIDMSHANSADIAAGESMKTVLAKLSQMKQDWEHEKMRLEGEREYLQSTADRLNQEVDQARHKNDDTRGVLSVGNRSPHSETYVDNHSQELDQARRAIADFEVQLQLERDRLRAITNERNRTVNEKNDILSNLERTQAVC
jgi:chromosome segregation ATPase